MTTPVTIGQLISASDYSSLAAQINTELTRRGGGTPVATSYSGAITATQFNALNTTLSGAITDPYSTGLLNVTSGSVMRASDFDTLLTSINTATAQILAARMTITQGSGQNITLNNAYFTGHGWNGSSPLEVYITISGIIGSGLTSAYALTLNGSYPAGSIINIHNTNYIVGAGGIGGNGAGGGGNGGNGGNGGPALNIASGTGATWRITNNGVIGGGGGGGGGGGWSGAAFGSGGGGGAGTPPGGGGVIGGTGYGATPGSPGTATAGGAGGSTLYAGGNGGNLGAPGGAGTAGFTAGGLVGAAGPATTGAANAIWQVVGTRYGAIG
jgi:hypothetical protein